jgi:membrane-bound serine protease (ClpP class)
MQKTTRTPRLLALLALVACLFSFVACEGTEREPAAPATVTHVKIEGQLDVGTLGLLRRAFAHADANEHERLVIEIDTPGGQVDLMWKIARLIDDRGSPELVVVAWVNDHALSAGVLLALACDEIYMSTESVIGAAMPVQQTPTGLASVPEDDGVREKLMSALRADFRAMAEKGGRPGDLAEAMIDSEIEIREVEIDGARKIVTGLEYDDARERGDEVVMLRTLVARGELLTLTSSRAIELGFVEGRADDLESLLEKVGEINARVDRLQRTRSEDVLSFIESIAPILIAMGLMLAFMEIKSPGFSLPGILALACFAVLLIGRYMAGLADIPHIMLVALGLALIAVEIFIIPGTLWAGLAGGVLVFFGLVAASLGPGFGITSEMQRSLLFDATFRLVLSAFVGLVGALILSRFLPQTPVLRRLVLDPDQDAAVSGMRPVPVYSGEPDVDPALAHIGAVGVARTALRPVGKVVLDQAPELELEARAAGDLVDGGARVRVIEVREGRLVVEPLA